MDIPCVVEPMAPGMRVASLASNRNKQNNRNKTTGTTGANKWKFFYVN
jgi:hypothetical protein